MYKLFLSYSLSESPIAKELYTQLNNAFKGNLDFFSASEQLASGVDWKKAIRDALKECQAGLFILTKKYQESKWSVSEFTAFWLEDKPIFLLCIGEIDKDSLYAPLKDYQIADISNPDDVKKFIERLANCLGEQRIPYAAADKISEKCSEAYKSLLIVNQDELFKELTSETKNKIDKSDKYLMLEDERFLRAVSLESDPVILRNIVLKALNSNINKGDLAKVIDHLSIINNAELRKLAIRLIQASKYDNAVFDQCISALALQNQAELIKVLRVLYFTDKLKYSHYVDDKRLVDSEKYQTKLDNWIIQGDENVPPVDSD